MVQIDISRRATFRLVAAGCAAAALRGSSDAKTLDCDVLILGAGISGLHAARMLEREGLSVRVIEGSHRVGGRCWTARDIPGRPEFGAQQVGFGYGRVRSNAADLGVELISPPSGSYGETRLPTLSISIGHQLPDKTPWSQSSMNQLRDDEKNLSPLQLYGNYILKDNPLVDLEDWQKPEFEHIDKMSLRQYLSAKGASPEALRLMNISIAARDLDDANALDFLRKQHYYVWEAKKGPYHIVRDGTDALTTAMARSLKQPVALHKIVTAIDARDDRVSVTCKDGSIHRARTCISTIPLSVMKSIKISGQIPPEQRQAWNAQRYNQLILVYLKVLSPFWEVDQMAPTMWTDGPYEVTLRPVPADQTNGSLCAYINGAGVEPLNRLRPEVLGQNVLAELIRLRPEAKGKVEVSHIHNWSTYPFARGHIAYFAPGNIARDANLTAQPVGSLFFAGEHNCRVHAGIEGACEAAENAAIQALAEIGKV